MSKIGILLHVYHLESPGWEELVWGEPATDTLGTVAQFAYTLLAIPADQQVRSIVLSGPSSKNGLIEGAYTKRFLLDHIKELSDFPTLRNLIRKLSPQDYNLFVTRVEELVVGPIINNTFEEVSYAADYFNDESPVDSVFQISAASHAPRCLKNQLLFRQKGIIPTSQPWYITPSGTNFAGTEIDDVVILEPPSRGDDPMTLFTPKLTEVIKPYFSLDPDKKQHFIKEVQALLSNMDNIG